MRPKHLKLKGGQVQLLQLDDVLLQSNAYIQTGVHAMEKANTHHLGLSIKALGYKQVQEAQIVNYSKVLI